MIEHCPWYADWIAHAAHDEFWQRQAVTPLVAETGVPALHIGGRFDIFVNQTVTLYSQMRTAAGTDRVGAALRLIIGPGSVEDVWHDGVRVDVVTPDDVEPSDPRVYLQFHGGALVFGAGEAGLVMTRATLGSVGATT